jgi:hypothetical protein
MDRLPLWILDPEDVSRREVLEDIDRNTSWQSGISMASICSREGYRYSDRCWESFRGIRSGEKEDDCMVTGRVEAWKDGFPCRDGKGGENEKCLLRLETLGLARCNIEDFDGKRPSECQEQQTRTPALVLKVLIESI